MRIYVAGKWSEKEAIRAFMERLRKAGHEITEDWTQHPASAEPGKAKDSTLLALDAAADLRGIKNAQILIAVMQDSKYPYRGTFFEIGFALGLGKGVMIVASSDPEAAFRAVAFFHVATIIKVNTEDDAMTVLSDAASL